MTKTNKQQSVQCFTNNSEEKFVKNKAYGRPKFYFDIKSQTYSIERYCDKENARNESRSAVIKIINQCDRMGYGISGFLKEVFEATAENRNTTATSIVKATPPAVLDIAIRSIVNYENTSNKKVTEVLSIRPVTDIDKRGAYVVRIELVDEPAKINRKYKAKNLMRAF